MNKSRVLLSINILTNKTKAETRRKRAVDMQSKGGIILASPRRMQFELKSPSKNELDLYTWEGKEQENRSGLLSQTKGRAALSCPWGEAARPCECMKSCSGEGSGWQGPAVATASARNQDLAMWKHKECNLGVISDKPRSSRERGAGLARR